MRPGKSNKEAKHILKSIFRERWGGGISQRNNMSIYQR